MGVSFPDGFLIEQLDRRHPRKSFDCGQDEVNTWLRKHARQSQDKRLSVTRVLLAPDRRIAGYYTLAIGQISMDELPPEEARKLPRTLLPVITLAWMGVARPWQGAGFGGRLLARALTDCYRTGQDLPVVAVILDCLDQAAKRFYKRFDFRELPGHGLKLFLSWRELARMMGDG